MIKHKAIKLVLQISAIIAVTAALLYLIISILAFRSYSIPFYGVSDIDEPSVSDDMQIVTTKYNKDLELNKKATISCATNGTEIIFAEGTYISCVLIGDVINIDEVLATNGNDNIYSPVAGRIINISEQDNSGDYYFEIDSFLNYEIILILQYNEAEIYFGLCNNKVDYVDITINGYTSQAKVAECYFESANQVFIIKINDFSFNPYIFDKYIVNVYKLIEKGEEFLLFPKTCFYELIDNDTIKVKKVISDDAGHQMIEEITLKIMAELSYGDYFFVRNASENVGLYIVTKES